MHDTLVVTRTAPVAISSGPVASIRVQCWNNFVYIQATAADVPPTSINGAIKLAASDAFTELTELASMFRGVGEGPYYLWAMIDRTTPVEVSVSHG